jgi:hypothetical protein
MLLSLPTTTRMTDSQNLMWALEGLGITPPQELSKLVAGYLVLAADAPARTLDPTRDLCNAAVNGTLTADTVDELCAKAVNQNAVAEYRAAVAQKASRFCAKRFLEILDDGAANAILDALKPKFDAAAQQVAKTLEVVDINTPDKELVAHATPKQLEQLRALPNILNKLDRIAAITKAFGTDNPTLPLIEHPSDKELMFRGNHEFGILRDEAIFCTTGDLLRDSRNFYAPNGGGDVRTSPWLRVEPKLHNLDEARERVRSYAADAWEAMNASRRNDHATLKADGTTQYRKYNNPFETRVKVTA